MSCKIYKFGESTADGDSSMKMTLGGKGANLAQMSKDGINVPPGFTIPTEECFKYYNNNQSLSSDIKNIIEEGIKFIEKIGGKKFGSQENETPLLVSVRSCLLYTSRRG